MHHTFVFLEISKFTSNRLAAKRLLSELLPGEFLVNSRRVPGKFLLTENFSPSSTESFLFNELSARNSKHRVSEPCNRTSIEELRS